MTSTGILFNGNIDAQKDRDHYFTDWESNIDGHLMVATEKYLSSGKQDFNGFKEYMRSVFMRPFVTKDHIHKWFDNLLNKLSGDGDTREQTLRDLCSELNI